MSTFGWSAALAVVGAVVGFFARTREFQRDKRLAAFADYADAFLSLAHLGAGMQSLFFALGESMYGERRAEVNGPWELWQDAWAKYERAYVRFRLVAGRRARWEGRILHDWMVANITTVDPIQRTFSDDFQRSPATEKWGADARVGPAHVEQRAVVLADNFVDRATRLVTRRTKSD
jgi:hypothetical protein